MTIEEPLKPPDREGSLTNSLTTNSSDHLTNGYVTTDGEDGSDGDDRGQHQFDVSGVDGVDEVGTSSNNANGDIRADQYRQASHNRADGERADGHLNEWERATRAKLAYSQ